MPTETNPNSSGSLLFTWCEKDSSEHFQDASQTPPLQTENLISMYTAGMKER